MPRYCVPAPVVCCVKVRSTSKQCTVFVTSVCYLAGGKGKASLCANNAGGGSADSDAAQLALGPVVSVTLIKCDPVS